MSTKSSLNNIEELYRGATSFQVCRNYRRSDTAVPDHSLLVRSENRRQKYEAESFPGEFSIVPPKGRVYDDKAFPMPLEANKEYFWCTCGISKSQPLCDGSHKRNDGKEKVKRRALFKPLAFHVLKEGIYHLCNCKQTSNPPYCDGTHRQKFVVDAQKNRS